MKLNANDFRISLEEKRKLKKQADESFLRMQSDLQAAVDKRNKYLTELCALALGAALNGQQELGLDKEGPTEYVDYLQKFGFELNEREVEEDSLLRKVREISPKELKALESRLRGELSKMLKIATPEVGSDLFEAYDEYVHADDELDLKVKHLLKVISLYNTAYHEGSDLSLDVDAKLWLYLSRLQDVIGLYDPENDTEECVQQFLRWEDAYVEIEAVPAADSPYSMLNPNKLRFINSEEGEVFFAKISEEMTAQTEVLESLILFELICNDDESHVVLPDGTQCAVPFCAQDLQLIFEKMGFKAAFKFRKTPEDVQVFSFKVRF